MEVLVTFLASVSEVVFAGALEAVEAGALLAVEAGLNGVLDGKWRLRGESACGGQSRRDG